VTSESFREGGPVERVTVSVSRRGDSNSRDLEVPADLQAGRLAGLIGLALGWEAGGDGKATTYVIEAHPPGRLLQPEETLADAGAWDGAGLVLGTVDNLSRPGSPGAETIRLSTAPGLPDGPVAGWQSLDLDFSAGPAPAKPSRDKSAKGFVWKRVDE